MALNEWESNPAYEADLEPPALKRLKCQACVAQWARVQCQLCSQQFCRSCETAAHTKILDAAAHRESLEPCNVCQDCRNRDPEFYCKDCDRYQCEGCCATAHGASESFKSHVWLCTEGTSARLLRFSKWEPQYVEFVKMARRNAQLEMEKQLAMKQEPPILPDYIPLPAAASPDEDDEATSDEEDHLNQASAEPAQEVMEIKLERVRLNDQADKASGAVSEPVAEEPTVTASPPEAESVPVKSEVVAPSTSQSLEVDTTEASDEAHGGMGLDAESETPAVSEDVHVKDESASQSADQPQASEATGMKAELVQDPDVEFVQPPRVAANVVDLTGSDDEENVPPVHGNVKKEEPSWSRSTVGDFALDSDPIRCQLIKAYNSQTKHIHEAQQHSVRLTQRATSAANFQDIQDCKQQLDALKATMTNATHGRDATLARLLVYVKHSDPDFQKLLTESTLNMPDAETAIHRECARLQMEINAKGLELQSCRAQVDEAIRMKPTESFAEVLRLGNDIAVLEKTIHELEKTRLDQLGNLCYVSEAIRAAARAMMGTSTASS